MLLVLAAHAVDVACAASCCWPARSAGSGYWWM